MATVTTDDGIKIDYEFDDFTNPWDDEAETIGLLHGSTLNKKFYAPMVPYLGRKFRVLRWDQRGRGASTRSEEHTSELQSLMRISYAVFCLKKKTTIEQI